MSKYSNTWPYDMEKACDNALSELQNNKLNGIIKEIDNNKMWNSSSKKKCTDALNNINTSTKINGSIEVLNSKLRNLKSAAQKIKVIKTREDDLMTEKKKPQESRDTAKINRLNNDINRLEREVDALLK